MASHEDIVKTYGQKLRTRVNGVLLEDENILMVRHQSLGSGGYLWNVPGGGMEYGQSAEAALKREFAEETGLKVKICDFLFVHELLIEPLHAIELFFMVEKTGGKLEIGLDPEMDEDKQIIEDVRFMPWSEISELAPDNKHNIFDKCKSLTDLVDKRGYFIFKK
ncbi:MAG: NUDIX domain-containing protein [Cyclobacteriaceae bacterium]